MHDNLKHGLPLSARIFSDSFIAGGCITSLFTRTPINDVDVYFNSERAFVQGIRQACEDGMYCLHVSSRAVTFASGDDILQLCKTVFSDTSDGIFDAFDFTCCMGAFNNKTKDFELHPDFLVHNSQRFLKFNPRTKYPIASLLRVLKYQAKGYSIGQSEMLKIALACRLPLIDSWEQFKEQVGGSYGESVVLDSDGKDFSIDLALDLLSSSNLTFHRKLVEPPAGRSIEDVADNILDLMGYNPAESPSGK